MEKLKVLQEMQEPLIDTLEFQQQSNKTIEDRECEAEEACQEQLLDLPHREELFWKVFDIQVRRDAIGVKRKPSP